MPATNQSAVSTLIREVLADPDLAHDDVFRRLPPGRAARARSGFGAAAVIGAQRHVAHAAAHQQAQRHEAQDRGHHRRGGGSRRSPSCAPDPSSRPCSTPAGGWTRPGCAVICSARSRGRLHPQGGRPRQGPGQRVGHQPLHGLADPRRASTRGSRSSCPAAWTAPGSPTCSPGATYLDVRVGHRVVCRALVVATGVSAEGRREILGMALGDAETVDFWTSFLRSLRERGLKVPSPHDPEGVVLVTSDAHAGIRAAVRAILPGAAWQRCRVHFARNITTRAGPGPTPSPRARSSRPSSPRPRPRSPPSTSTSSTL